MITRDLQTFRTAWERLPAKYPAVPSSVFMVLPERFRVDSESEIDNAYLNQDEAVNEGRAMAQAQALADAIEAAGVPVKRFPGRVETPDAVFPNNVFATVPGRFIVGSMFHGGRREEARRQDIREHFLSDCRRSLHDLSERDCVAELTGPLVLDRARSVGFCGMSTRVDQAGLEAMHQAFNLKLTLSFDLQVDEYHTNVVLSILASRACVFYAGAFSDPQVAQTIARLYPQRNLPITSEEKNAFAANCIALSHEDMFISETAWDTLQSSSKATLQSWGFKTHVVAVDELEKAGGSLRCMVAEVF